METRVIKLKEDFGWRTLQIRECKVHFKGYLNNCKDLYFEISNAFERINDVVSGKLSAFPCLDGHFAIVFQKKEYTAALVDRVRSIPLLWAEAGEGDILISDHAAPIIKELGLTTENVNLEVARDIAIAGYSLSRDTLYNGVTGLLAGEILIIEDKKPPVVSRYANYSPWLVEKKKYTDSQWRARLGEVTLGVIEKMITRANGRQLLLPLSAGLDSRLIASALKHLGYENVHCFSYGRAGNHEAAAAKQIAAILEYPWNFIPTESRAAKKFRKSPEFKRYYDLADSLTATPVEQDVYTVMKLRDQPWVQNDAIIVNGQSGDFISGNHIPENLITQTPTSIDEASNLLVTEMLSKHYDLWSDLKTPENISRIKKRIFGDLVSVSAPIEDANMLYALYEFSEFRNRQSKYVTGNQRGYELYGWNWHWPLWDNDYLEFWQTVPVRLKYQQKLYRDMLIHNNWGGVWRQLLPAPRWITPRSLRPLRNLCHLACLPFGESTWNRFDKRFFNYFTDHLRKYSAVNYLQVVLGPNHRNVVAWLTKLYLEKHGLARDGTIKNYEKNNFSIYR
jgi:asparagine synthase (glutamine-hydrolysing)